MPRSHLPVLARLLLAVLATTQGAWARTLNLADFGAKPDGSDTTPCVRAALDAARRDGASKLVLPPGRYDFWPERAEERYLFVSNNDEGLKRIAFPLVGISGLEIDGGGASLVFHGPMVPFLVEDSRGITLRNLSFDFVRPFHSEGEVLAVAPDSVDVAFSEEFPFSVRHGVLVFTGGAAAKGPETTVKSGETIYPYGSLLAFDPRRRETAFLARDFYGTGEGIAAREIGPRRVRLQAAGVSAAPGQVLVFGAKFREYPGIVVSDSAGVRLEAVTIHHCGGMGVIAQRSADLTLRRVVVAPPPGGRRIVSITADATHFVNCRGSIEMIECRFEQQKDDATNIHGLYARIVRILAPDRFEVCLVHPQQAGIDFVRAGTRLELTHGPSLRPLGEAKVRAVRRLNKALTEVELTAPLPQGVAVGDSVADAEANTAVVRIERCLFRGNRARGLLLGSRGRTEIVGNTFHIPGAAILFEGDARFWFEQAGVREVLIRDNLFDDCNFGVWGKACIEVAAGIDKPFRATSRYNHNLVIENNRFRAFRQVPLVSLYSVDGAVIRGNSLVRTTTYPAPTEKAREWIEVVDSDRVQAEAPVVKAP